MTAKVRVLGYFQRQIPYLVKFTPIFKYMMLNIKIRIPFHYIIVRYHDMYISKCLKQIFSLFSINLRFYREKDPMTEYDQTSIYT